MKIISGGQTGIDKLALEIAKEAGFNTGGTAPKGWKTEYGPDLTLKDFGLKESWSSQYSPRTEANVKDSDGTVLYGDTRSRGSMITIEKCTKLKKPFIINPTDLELIEFIQKWSIKELNVAGNRDSLLSMNHRAFMKTQFERALYILKS